MSFNPSWAVIGRTDHPIPDPIVAEVTRLLFSADPPEHSLESVEVCIVLGSRDCGYKAHRAAELFGANPNVVFVACGANESVRGQPEAELIREVLLTRGIAPARVLIDEHSTNTIENLWHAERLIADRIGDPGDKKVAVLSSGFHRRHVIASLPRSLAHACYVSAAGPHSGPDTWHTNDVGRRVVLHELMRPGFDSGHTTSLADVSR